MSSAACTVGDFKEMQARNISDKVNPEKWNEMMKTVFCTWLLLSDCKKSGIVAMLQECLPKQQCWLPLWPRLKNLSNYWRLLEVFRQ